MSYCTQEDIKARIPASTLLQLTQDDRNKEVADDARINAAIFDSDAIINDKLTFRYTLPFNPVPPSIIRIAVDLAIYYIYRARIDNTMPETVQSNYDNALKRLDALADGSEVLFGVERKSGFVFDIQTNMKNKTMADENLIESDIDNFQKFSL